MFLCKKERELTFQIYKITKIRKLQNYKIKLIRLQKQTSSLRDDYTYKNDDDDDALEQCYSGDR